MSRVDFARRADREVDTIDAWWRENRPAAPNLFASELAGAVALLQAQPEAGERYLLAFSGRVRRLLLPRTRYYLYYKYDAPRDIVTVVSVWSCIRGRGPRLR